MAKIKICGLYRFDDIEFVNSAKPDYCGFIINFPKSHRNIDENFVRILKEKLDEGITPVGVFVNQNMEYIAELLNDGTIKIAQLHGDESNEFIDDLKKTCPGCEVWKAFKIRSKEDLKRAENSSADMVLLDNGYGTGESFDWSIIENFSRPYILAGGLTPENINKAVLTLNPYGIDISSGVETDGVKDKEKIKAAVRAAGGNK